MEPTAISRKTSSFPNQQSNGKPKNESNIGFAAADNLLGGSQIPEDRKAELRSAIRRARSALSRYDDLRGRGTARAMIIAPIKASAGGIVADDVTIIGVSDDWILIPLALAAIATYAVTDARATQEQLGRAWNETLASVGALAFTVQDILTLAAPGNVADTGIMAEANALISAGRAATICAALAILFSGVKKAKDKEGRRRKRRIEATQKLHGCRHSRKAELLSDDRDRS